MSKVLQLTQPTEAEFEALLREIKEELDGWEESIRIKRQMVVKLEDMELAGRRRQALHLLREMKRNMA